MQQPFMKLFSTNKHGQVLVLMNNLELSVTWKVDHTMYVNTLPNFNSVEQIQEAFDACNREIVSAIVSNVKFLDNGDFELNHCNTCGKPIYNIEDCIMIDGYQHHSKCIMSKTEGTVQ